MKTLQPILFPLAICFMLLTGMKCKKDNQQPDKEQLPPVTQTGAHTFGFLLNGEVWLPKTPLLMERLDLTYDPDYKSGSFGITANRYLSSESEMRLSIGLIGVNKIGKYDFQNNGVIYKDTKSGCYYFENRIVTGSITITKLDLANKFISGTFEFKLEKDGCPTINATQGRFDLKIE
jgi:hypothetical protein